jgi:hypothetical protein
MAKSKLELPVTVIAVYMRGDGDARRREFMFEIANPDKHEDTVKAYLASFDVPPVRKEDGVPLYFARCFEDGNLRVMWANAQLELEAAVNGSNFDLSALIIRENADTGYWDLFCTRAK